MAPCSQLVTLIFTTSFYDVMRVCRALTALLAGQGYETDYMILSEFASQH